MEEPPDAERNAKLDRIEAALDRLPNQMFAFDEFGPLGIRPTTDSRWAERKHPDRMPATYHRTHGTRYFHGCYSVGDDRLWGGNHRRKGAANTLATLKSLRAARPDGAPIHVILDNLSAHKGADIRHWAKKNVELCFTPTYASWANPFEAHFGPLRQFTIANSPTPTTPCRPGPRTPACAGATPTPATATSWPPNAQNSPASAAKKGSTGADAPSKPQPQIPTAAGVRSGLRCPRHRSVSTRRSAAGRLAPPSHCARSWCRRCRRKTVEPWTKRSPPGNEPALQRRLRALEESASSWSARGCGSSSGRRWTPTQGPSSSMTAPVRTVVGPMT